MTDRPTILSPTEIRFERLLPGPIETVWAFLTDPQKRGEWLASGPMDLRVGGRVSLRFKHSDLSPNKAPPPADRYAGNGPHRPSRRRKPSPRSIPRAILHSPGRAGRRSSSTWQRGVTRSC